MSIHSITKLEKASIKLNKNLNFLFLNFKKFFVFLCFSFFLWVSRCVVFFNLNFISIVCNKYCRSDLWYKQFITVLRKIFEIHFFEDVHLNWRPWQLHYSLIINTVRFLSSDYLPLTQEFNPLTQLDWPFASFLLQIFSIFSITILSALMVLFKKNP